MNSIKEIQPSMHNDKHLPFAISNDQIVLGYDEYDKKFKKVQYRRDSNVFFDYPYTGALYSKDRMHKFKTLS